VRAAPVIFHGRRILHDRRGTAHMLKPSPKGEGFNPPR
jgi:hypothetical protein